MREAVIVSTARTGLAKSVRGGFNMTHGAALAGHAIKHAVERAKLEPGEVEDVYIGCANPEGATGGNIARQAALWADLPDHRRRRHDQPLLLLGPQRRRPRRAPDPRRPDIMVGGGVESISLVQLGPRAAPGKDGRNRTLDEKLLEEDPGDLHDDDRDRRDRRRALQDQPRIPGRVRACSRSSAPPPPRPPASTRTRSSRWRPRWRRPTRRRAKSPSSTTR